MLDSSIVEASSAEGSKALQEARACLDHMRPLVALLVHVSRPSQLRASSDPQQALQAIRNALLDIAATCNISTWTHARLLAVQVNECPPRGFDTLRVFPSFLIPRHSLCPLLSRAAGLCGPPAGPPGYQQCNVQQSSRLLCLHQSLATGMMLSQSF